MKKAYESAIRLSLSVPRTLRAMILIKKTAGGCDRRGGWQSIGTLVRSAPPDETGKYLFLAVGGAQRINFNASEKNSGPPKLPDLSASA